MKASRDRVSPWPPRKPEKPELAPEEDARRRRVYEALKWSGTNAEAAEILGISRSAFHMWHHSRGLPPLRPCMGIPKTLKGFSRREWLREEIRRLRVLAGAKSEREAAEEVGVTFQTMNDYTRYRKVPPIIPGRSYWEGVRDRANEKLSKIADREQQRAAFIVRKLEELEMLERKDAIARLALSRPAFRSTDPNPRGEGYAVIGETEPERRSEAQERSA